MVPACEGLFAESHRVTPSAVPSRASPAHRPHQILPWTEPAPARPRVLASNQSLEGRSRKTPRSTWIGVQVPELQRRARIQHWKTGAVPSLYANRMLLEGFDEPNDARTSGSTKKPTAKSCSCRWPVARATAQQVARLYCATADGEEQLRAALQRCNRPQPQAGLTRPEGHSTPLPSLISARE